ncbi:hypothetical protein J4429_00870 [Candidatus Pacearchaeota archaeon]|nr:hypothetical protein [Candidatus Pacearchaeota archaeon]
MKKKARKSKRKIINKKHSRLGSDKGKASKIRKIKAFLKKHKGKKKSKKKKI